jgi:hypothetical protein
MRTSVEAVLVTAADALSAARPGARREILENYIKRLEKLESMATDLKGVEKAFAIQAGRELRIVVESDKISDEDAIWLSRDVAKKVEAELTYPGQIKVTVIRETRAVEYAGDPTPVRRGRDGLGRAQGPAPSSGVVWWTRRTSTSWWPTSRTPPEDSAITPAILEELDELPVNVWTTGNHVWDKKEGVPLLDAHPTLLRPANYPEGNPGRGLCVETTAAGIPVAVMNLQGQVMMPPIDNPFRVADRLLEQLREERRDVRVVLVDMHAEATSEKQGIAYYLDGRVTAVLGTHTHVPTADERVLPKGTALQTDVGMTGPYESDHRDAPEKILERFL